jgi:hypothetical protein
MGEYADMSIESGLSNYIDFKTNSGIYENYDYLDEWDGEDIPIIRAKKWDSFEFLEIKRETEKAWLLIMNGKAERWFPKKHCRIKGNTILLPIWLRNKMAGW